MSTQATLGQKALENRNHAEAIKQFTTALSTNVENPSPLWLIQRSTAYQRSGEHDLALLDADAALLAAKRRARRELVATAQFRRAVALHGLKRYGDARLCLVWCRNANEKEKGLGIWQAKVAKDFETAEQEQGADSPVVKTTVKEIPDKVEVVGVKETDDKVAAVKGEFPAPTPAPVASSVTPKEKIRHEWYQTGSKVTVTVFAKGVPKDKAEIDIDSDSLDISFPVAGSDSTFSLNFDPLFAGIDPKESTFSVTPNKVEIILHKSTPNVKWSALEGDQATRSTPKTDSKPTAQAPTSSSATKGPAYPTSSRTGPKDWDALADLEKENDDEKGVDDFFKTLYKNADPDSQKAMLKSYQESNGTALSMNWNEVKSGPVPTQPPEGVEAKKW